MNHFWLYLSLAVLGLVSVGALLMAWASLEIAKHNKKTLSALYDLVDSLKQLQDTRNDSHRARLDSLEASASLFTDAHAAQNAFQAETILFQGLVAQELNQHEALLANMGPPKISQSPPPDTIQ